MSKNKVQFAEGDIILNAEDLKAKDSKSNSSLKSRTFKEKHSLDSDEEDDNKEKEDVLEEDDIEGQEDDTIEFDGGISITPFNMREEHEEGYFNKDGNYVFNKEKEIRDSWMDNIDWVKVQRSGKSKMDDDDDDIEPEKIDVLQCYGEMIKYMKPGETVLKALKRLGGGKAMSASERWKKKKQGAKTADKSGDGNKQDLDRLTGLADKVLSNGDMAVYQETFERLQFRLDQAKREEEAKKTTIPDGVDDDDALDMFAASFDDKADEFGFIKCMVFKEPSAKKVKFAAGPEKKTEAIEAQASEDSVRWEYKEKLDDDVTLCGPFSTEQMLRFQEEGKFKEGVYCRRVGTESQFYHSKRIDFDLYI